MAEYSNENTGVLFQNDKDGNEKRPDYKGKLNVEGVDFEIAGWKRLSKAGKPFLSLKISEPRQTSGSGYDSFKQQGEKLKQKDEVAEDTGEDMEDLLASIPF